MAVQPIPAKFWVMRDAQTDRVFATAALDGRLMQEGGTATRVGDDVTVTIFSPDGGKAHTLVAREAEELLGLGFRLT